MAVCSQKICFFQAIFSALAAMTDMPLLHNQLVGTSEDQNSKGGQECEDRTLMDILVEIWNEAEDRLGEVSDAEDKLEWMRRSLGVSNPVPVRHFWLWTT